MAMVQPLGPDPSGHNEYVEEREREREFQDQAERERQKREAEQAGSSAEPAKKPSFWQRLFGKK